MFKGHCSFIALSECVKTLVQQASFVLYITDNSPSTVPCTRALLAFIMMPASSPRPAGSRKSASGPRSTSQPRLG